MKARAGALGFVAGALLALGVLAVLPPAGPAAIPAITAPGEDGPVEQWIVRDADVLAVTSGPAGREPAAPAGIGPLTEARLVATEAATMKIRNRAGAVIGIASRLIGPQGDGRAALWTFVLGPRGTLAAEVARADSDGHGRLAGGTGEFADLTGRFVEQPRPQPGLRWRLEVAPGP